MLCQLQRIKAIRFDPVAHCPGQARRSHDDTGDVRFTQIAIQAKAGRARFITAKHFSFRMGLKKFLYILDDQLVVAADLRLAEGLIGSE